MNNGEVIKKRQKREKLIFLGKLIVFFGLIYLKFRHPELKEHLGIPPNYIAAFFFFVISHLLVSFSRITIVHVYAQSRKLGDKTDNFILGIQQIANIISFFLFLFAVLILLDINIKELFTSLSIIAAAIAILSKDYISNMINGMIIMFSNQFSLNDYVKIGNHKGKIVDITLVSVHLMNDNDDLVYIPNSQFYTVDVVNYTKRQINKVNVEFETKTELIDNIERLEDYLIKAVKEKDYDDHILKDSLNLRTLDIKNDIALLNFQYIMKETNKDIEKEIKKTIMRSVIRYININRHGFVT